MKTYVFDSTALFTFIENENGINKVESLLQQAINKEVEIFTSVVSSIEVFYVSYQKQGKDVARNRISLLEVLPLIQIELTNDLVEIIGEIKATKKMSFADCCIAGLAKLKNAILVHKDPEFEQVENEIEQLKLPYKQK
jgi:predicted nucleic acid-binding protein